jgi:hypothetical protein
MHLLLPDHPLADAGPHRRLGESVGEPKVGSVADFRNIERNPY